MIDAAGFGRALFELAVENGTTQRVHEELAVICQALREQPEYVTLLDTPAIGVEEKLSLLRTSLGAAEPMLLNCLCILCEKREIHRLPACAAAYGACFDEAQGILRATAVTAVPMQERQKSALCRKLETITGKTVVLTNRTDERLIGGITLRYAGVQLDDSIRARLDSLHRKLNDTIV